MARVISRIVRPRREKRIISQCYSPTFGGQRAIRLTCKPRTVRRSLFEMMDTGRWWSSSSYGRHEFGPGQKVWVVVQHRKTRQLSVRATIIEEIFAFGQVGHCGPLYQYWLRDHSIGHGVEYRENMFVNRNEALCAMYQVRTRREVAL